MPPGSSSPINVSVGCRWSRRHRAREVVEQIKPYSQAGATRVILPYVAASDDVVGERQELYRVLEPGDDRVERLKEETAMPFELINPEGLEAPIGYAHVAKITGGTVVHVAGQAPFNEKGQVVGRGDFVAQFAQVMSNLKTAIEAAGGRPEPIRGVDDLYHPSRGLLEQQKTARHCVPGSIWQILPRHYPGRS